MEDQINEIVQMLAQIEEDSTAPKNVRARIRETINILQEEEQDMPVKVNKSLQELDELNNDPNVPQYIRTQIWSIVSSLEIIQK